VRSCARRFNPQYAALAVKMVTKEQYFNLVTLARRCPKLGALVTAAPPCEALVNKPAPEITWSIDAVNQYLLLYKTCHLQHFLEQKEPISFQQAGGPNAHVYMFKDQDDLNTINQWLNKLCTKWGFKLLHNEDKGTGFLHADEDLPAAQFDPNAFVP